MIVSIMVFSPKGSRSLGFPTRVDSPAASIIAHIILISWSFFFLGLAANQNELSSNADGDLFYSFRLDIEADRGLNPVKLIRSGPSFLQKFLAHELDFPSAPYHADVGCLGSYALAESFSVVAMPASHNH